MVSFNRNDVQGFPIQLGSPLNRSTSNLLGGKFQRINEFQQTISVTWGRLLESASEVVSITSHLHNRQHVVNTHSALSKVIVSVLNQCQLMIWMHETKAETLSHSAKSANDLTRTKESIQRDLDQLRQMVDDSDVRCQFCRRVMELIDRLT